MSWRLRLSSNPQVLHHNSWVDYGISQIVCNEIGYFFTMSVEAYSCGMTMYRFT
jgi:hypothetical protein